MEEKEKKIESAGKKGSSHRLIQILGVLFALLFFTFCYSTYHLAKDLVSNQKDKKGFEDAYDWFLKSAEKDYGPSEVMTAYLLKTGIVKTDDPNGAWKWSQKALGEGDGLGAWLLAQICSERGFDKDIIYE